MSDQGSEGLLSPFLRNRRIAAARPYLNGRILDYGCGTGKLAAFVPPAQYVGVDIDAESLTIAQRNLPNHQFLLQIDPPEGEFDTIIALAVIEHVRDPVACLRGLAARLTPGSKARIVCTTPHPAVDWIHTAGASLGLFSRHANEEHEELLDRKRLLDVGRQSELTLAIYRRFLMGANQLAVYQHSGQKS